MDLSVTCVTRKTPDWLQNEFIGRTQRGTHLHRLEWLTTLTWDALCLIPGTETSKIYLRMMGEFVLKYSLRQV